MRRVEQELRRLTRAMTFPVIKATIVFFMRALSRSFCTASAGNLLLRIVDGKVHDEDVAALYRLYFW